MIPYLSQNLSFLKFMGQWFDQTVRELKNIASPSLLEGPVDYYAQCETVDLISANLHLLHK